MKKSMCDSPQIRLGSKKAPGGCKCGGKCGPCKAKAKKAGAMEESMESEADEPDDDRDDSYSRSVVVTDSMTAFRFDQPNCKPGNKVCGGRCIPQEYDCEGSLRRKAQGRFMGAVGLGAGGVAAAKIGEGMVNEGLTSPDTIEYTGRNLTNRYTGQIDPKKMVENYGDLKKLKGGRKATRGLALAAAALPLAAGSIVQNVRGVAALRQADIEKKRKDSFWASGFEHESAESL